MKLSKLLEDVNVLCEYEDTEITDVTDKSGNISEGCAYVCVKGARFDGHTYAETAIINGAAVVITERDLGIKNQVVVDNTRKAYALMCKNYFGRGVQDKVQEHIIKNYYGEQPVGTSFLININELNKALDCVNYEYSYRCGELN